MPIEQYPAAVVFPMFAMPAYLGGGPYQKGIDITGVLTIGYGNVDPTQAAQRLGARSFRYTARFEKATFERLLLKVAYGVVVGQLALSRIERAYVIDAIMGRSDDIGRWLGYDEQHLLNREPFHAAGVGIVNGDILCRVRIFGMPAPEYIVVVGRAAAPLG